MSCIYHGIGGWGLWILVAFYYLADAKSLTNTNYHPCIRPCTRNSSMTCNYKFTLEYYSTVGQACDLCSPNGTYQQLREKPTCQCVLADGYERGVLTINRMIPGPSIQVCLGDTIVVDVHNEMDGQEVTIHWHGIFQQDFQYYDGVPFVTQCPISSGQIFRYKFGANNQGSHFHHSHSGVQKIDGISGALIVREPVEDDFHRDLYDFDLPEHVVFISDLMHRSGSDAIPGYFRNNVGQKPDSFLINGFGRFTDPLGKDETSTPLEIFIVKPNKRYRFRFINGLCTVCVSHLIIEGHNMTIIATDGEDVSPKNVGSIMSFSGERYDVVIETNQQNASYWIEITSGGECDGKRIHQTAILRYEGQPEMPTSPKPTRSNPLSAGKTYGLFENIDCSDENHKGVCLTDLESVKTIESPILAEDPDVQILLPYKVELVEPNVAFAPGEYKKFITQTSTVRLEIDGITYKAPPSPMISQSNDKAVHGLYCNRHENRSLSCGENDCSCSHIHHVKLGSVVEIVLWDTSESENRLPHPFHQHGYSFYVMKQGAFIDGKNNSQVDIWSVLEAYRSELRDKKIKHPPGKDTVVVPSGGGYVIFRFQANNPGFWFLHCHFLYHTAIGMNVVIHVGEEDDLPKVPENFPTCGNFFG